MRAKQGFNSTVESIDRLAALSGLSKERVACLLSTPGRNCDRVGAFLLRQAAEKMRRAHNKRMHKSRCVRRKTRKVRKRK